MTIQKISLRLRLGTMFLDHAIMCIVIAPPMILVSILVNSEPFETKPIEMIAFYLMILVYLNKDFVNGKSISKRILGLRVIDRRTGEPANEFKCFIRNITIPMWSLEVFISLFSPTRRLGDFIANTEIQVSEKEKPISILQDLKLKKLGLSSFYTMLGGLIYIGVLWYLMDSIMSK